MHNPNYAKLCITQDWTRTPARIKQEYAHLCLLLPGIFIILRILLEAGDDTDCTKILAEHEWKALYLKINSMKKLPDKPPVIAQVIRWITKLGGFLGRKNNNNPGITVIWRGWARFTEIADDYLLFSNRKLVDNS